MVVAGKKQLPPVRLATEADSPSPPMSLTEASERGDRLEELKAMKRIIVAHMVSDTTLARDLAALTRQVREMSKEIESLEKMEAEREEEVATSNGSADAQWKPEVI